MTLWCQVWFETRVELLEQLGWEQWAQHEQLQCNLNNVGRYAPF